MNCGSHKFSENVRFHGSVIHENSLDLTSQDYGGYTCSLRRLYIMKKPLLGRTDRGPTTMLLMTDLKVDESWILPIWNTKCQLCTWSLKRFW